MHTRSKLAENMLKQTSSALCAWAWETDGQKRECDHAFLQLQLPSLVAHAELMQAV